MEYWAPPPPSGYVPDPPPRTDPDNDIPLTGAALALLAIFGVAALIWHLTTTPATAFPVAACDALPASTVAMATSTAPSLVLTNGTTNTKSVCIYNDKTYAQTISAS